MVIEQQRHHVAVPANSGGDDERRPAVIRPGRDVGAVFDEQSGLFQIGHRPHERRGSRIVGDVRVGALIEERLHQRRIAVKHRRHERRRAAPPA